MDSEESVRSKLFTRRSFILTFSKLGIMSAILSRMYYLQVIKSNDFKTLADSNRIRVSLISPLRGNIFDRNGEILAGNHNYYRVLFDKDDAKEVHKSINTLLDLLDVSEDGKKYIIKKIMQNKAVGPMVVFEHLSWGELAKIEVNTPELPGVYVDVGQSRYYPYLDTCCHAIGYVGPVSEKETNYDQRLINHPDFKVGKNGIEKILEYDLNGTPGVRKIEVNAHGYTIRELSVEPSKPGNDVALTLDARLQEFVKNKLPIRGAAAVVMNVKTGDILSLVSNPGFDPNQFTQGISSDYWNDLVNNQDLPLINKAISIQYPPGSIFKVVVALASLEDGLDPETRVNCPGYVMLGDHKFRCWKEGGHGTMNLHQAIAHSCNTYFYTIARKIGIDKIANIARLLGLGNKTGIDLPSEKQGLIPDKRWKKTKFNREWQVGDTLNTAIGQGFVLATPIQLAVLCSRIASLGKKVTPNFRYMEENQNNPNLFEDLPINKKHLEFVQKGMEAVVNVPGCTAFGSRIIHPLYAMAGKTGTSQVISKKYATQDLSAASTQWKEKNHGLFVCYGPINDPTYACSVVVEHGGSGSAAAAPLGRDILLETIHLLYNNNETKSS